MTLDNFNRQENDLLDADLNAEATDISLDSIDDLEQEFESIEANLSDTTKMAENIVERVIATYEKSGAEMPAKLQAQTQHLVDEYVVLLGEAQKLLEKQAKIEENRDKPTKRSKRKQMAAKQALEQAELAKSQITKIVKQFTDTPDAAPVPPRPFVVEDVVIDEPGVDFEIDEPDLEIDDDNLTENVDLVEVVPTKKSLPEGLLRLQEEGVAYLNENQEALAKMGVTTFDATPGGDIEKGGLKGIVELQNFLIAEGFPVGATGADGIKGVDTDAALEAYNAREKEINVDSAVRTDEKGLDVTREQGADHYEQAFDGLQSTDSGKKYIDAATGGTAPIMRVKSADGTSMDCVVWNNKVYRYADYSNVENSPVKYALAPQDKFVLRNGKIEMKNVPPRIESVSASGKKYIDAATGGTAPIMRVKSADGTSMDCVVWNNKVYRYADYSNVENSPVKYALAPQTDFVLKNGKISINS